MSQLQICFRVVGVILSLLSCGAAFHRRADGVSYLDLDSRPGWIDMKPIINVFEAALKKLP